MPIKIQNSKLLQKKKSVILLSGKHLPDANLTNFKFKFSRVVFEKKSVFFRKKTDFPAISRSLYNDPIYIKLVCLFMRHGKKEKAEKIVYNTIKNLDKEYPNRAFHILYKAVLNCLIVVGVRTKSRKSFKKSSIVNKKIQYSPRILKERSMLNLGIRSIMQATLKRPWNISLEDNLKNELIACAKGNSSPVEFAHRSANLAFKNRYNLHYRWVIKQ